MDEAISNRLDEIKAHVLKATHKSDGTAHEQARSLGLAVYELINLLEVVLQPIRFHSDPGVAVPGAEAGNEAQKAEVAVKPAAKKAKE